MDFFRGDVQFLCQERQECRVVVLLNARGNGRLFVHFVFVVVERVRYQTQDGDELRLLVEFEVVVDIPINFSLCQS
jgi:hypothetical protein